MSIQQAKVKSVLSGDTIILTAVGNPKNERVFSLAYVSAPRLRRDGDEVRQLPKSKAAVSLTVVSHTPSNLVTLSAGCLLERLFNFVSFTR